MKISAPIVLCALSLWSGFILPMRLIAEGNPPATADENSKPCFVCKGTGISSCAAPSCQKGQVDCPGSCLKLSKGSWIHMEVAGHSPTELWQRFPSATGGISSWNQNHCGEVIQMQNGQPVNIGACKICGGAARVTCKVCGGTGRVTCVLCGGKKTVPESWTPFDNPHLKSRPNLFKLQDGREIRGRSVMASGGTTLIRTEKGDVKVPTAEILSETKQSTAK